LEVLLSGTARAHYILAHVLLAGAVLQFFFGGQVIFGAAPSDLHIIVGNLLLGLSLIALVLAALSRRALTFTAALFVAMLIQGFLPDFRATAPGLAALHPLNAVLILFLALATFHGAMPSLRPLERGGGDGLGRPGQAATSGERARVR